MIKKLLALLLALTVVFSLVACGGKKNVDTEEKKEETSDDTSVEEGEESTMLDFEELVIYDQDKVTFKLNSIDTAGEWGYTMNFNFKNESDLKLSYDISYLNVNDVMVTPTFTLEDENGFFNVALEQDLLDKYGIEEISKIEFTAVIYDTENFSVEPMFEEIITVHPLGRKIENPYVHKPVENEIVLIDTEDCTVSVVGFSPEEKWGYMVELYIYNKTDRALAVYADEGSLNGKQCDPMWSTEVAPGKHSFSAVAWSQDELDSNGIETVTDIDLKIRVTDATNWMSAELASEEVSFKPF